MSEKNDERTAIVMRNYSAGYKKEPVLQGVNFQAEIGQVIALLGDNGAGKTTLFRSIMQLLPYQMGQIRILGRTIEGKSDQRLLWTCVDRMVYLQSGKAGLFYSRHDIFLLGIRYCYDETDNNPVRSHTHGLSGRSC